MDGPRLPPAGREHELTGKLNPRCLRCHRTLIDIVVHPAPCRRTPVKAELPAVGQQARTA